MLPDTAISTDLGPARQMTRPTVGGHTEIECRFSGTNNDGRITHRKDWVSGEEVEYLYDSLGRLTRAETTGAGGWGQDFTYDGFGNLSNITTRKGTLTQISLTFDQTTNRIAPGQGFTYDNNGNTLTTPLLTNVYDWRNRLTSSTHTSNGTETYGYLASNRRLWKTTASGTIYYFYGIEGQLLGQYKYDNQTDDRPNYIELNQLVYFAGRLIWKDGQPVRTDRLGSVVKHGSQRYNYTPYGEEIGAQTPNGTEKFGTYHRDNTGLDYAVNRYNSAVYGRFMTPDPYQASAGAVSPASWNRYTYVTADPVNLTDPSGLLGVPADMLLWAASILGLTRTDSITVSASPTSSIIVLTWPPRQPHARAFTNRELQQIERESCEDNLTVNDVIDIAFEFALDMTPVVGELRSAMDAYRQFQDGNIGSGIVSLACALPVGGRIYRGTNTFRKALQRITGAAGAGAHAHHVFSKEFSEVWSKLGIEWSNPVNGAWWGASDHLHNAWAYNAEWRKWIADNRSLIDSDTEKARQMAVQKAKELMTQFGITW